MSTAEHEPTEPTEIAEAFAEIVRLAERRGVTSIGQLAGCWETSVGPSWWIAVNGHAHPVRCTHGVDVPPFAAYVEYNGWPAGLFNPRGGEFVAGASANESAFIEALRGADVTAAVIRLSPTPRPGDRFELRNHLGAALGRIVEVDSVYRVRSGRAMVVCTGVSGPRGGEAITVEFRDGAQTGWRHEYGMSDVGVARYRAEEWKRLVDTGELVHVDEDDDEERGGAA